MSPYIVLSAVLVLAGIPLVFRLVPPNYWFGFRTRLTLRSREAWYGSNRVAGFSMIAAGLAAYVAFHVSRPHTFIVTIAVLLAGLILSQWKASCIGEDDEGEAPGSLSVGAARGLRLKCVALSLLFLGIGLPLAFQVVPPNAWYGFRTAKAMSSPDHWYLANCLLGYYLIGAGAVSLLLVSLGSFSRRLQALGPFVMIGTPVFLATIAVALAALHYYAL